MQKTLRIAYFGTPDFSARFLEKIHQDPELPIEIVLVVTQPDKPIGRDQKVTPSDVKKVAQEKGIPVVHAVTAQDLVDYHIDLGLVFAYGKIIRAEVLEAAPHGFWNIHPSLLPIYRGASPTAYTLLMGDEYAGCTLMHMDAQMDHGPIIAQDSYKVSPHETHASLLEKLTYVAYYLFKENILRCAEGTLDVHTFQPQNDTMASFTRILKRDDGYIQPSLLKKALAGEKITTDELPMIIKNFLGQNSVSSFPILYAPFILYNMFRGLHPWPGLWTYIDHQGARKRLKITGVELENKTVHIRSVQLEGKNEVPFEQFTQAYPGVLPTILNGDVSMSGFEMTSK